MSKFAGAALGALIAVAGLGHSGEAAAGPVFAIGVGFAPPPLLVAGPHACDPDDWRTRRFGWGWHPEWREHEWRERAWREHERREHEWREHEWREHAWHERAWHDHRDRD